MQFEEPRKHVFEIYNEAVEAANPEKCVLEHITFENNTLAVEKKSYNLDDHSNIYVIALGKAAASMASAVEKTLGERITEGIIVTNSKPEINFKHLEFYLSSHPVPDDKSIVAADKVCAILNKSGEKDIVIFLISGGGSALLTMPSPGISFEDARKATAALLGSGVDKYGLNAVRKHISAIKGGGLLKKALPSQVITLVLSNVVSDRLDAIASGPTVADPTTYDDALRVIEALRIEHLIPPKIVLHLEDGRRGSVPETLKEGEIDHDKVQTIVVGSNYISLISSKQKAEEHGYNTLILSSQVYGEAKDVAKVIAAIAFDVERFDMPVKKPACLIFGGETAVTVYGGGKGGRNTECALSFAMDIIGHNIVGLFCDTDGIDGPIDAAGAVCDGQSRLKAREINVSARDHLAKNDSYNFFQKLGDLVITGPTGTNVMDIGVVIIQ